jgi:hypothetical protein
MPCRFFNVSIPWTFFCVTVVPSLHVFNRNVKPVLFCKGAGGAGVYFAERLVAERIMGRNEKHL